MAYLNDQMIDLSAREISLLEVLLQRAGRLVSKDQLVARLCEWGEEVSNNAIEVYIHRLRRRSSMVPCASPPCAGWAIAWRRFPAEGPARGGAPARRPGAWPRRLCSP